MAPTESHACRRALLTAASLLGGACGFTTRATTTQSLIAEDPVGGDTKKSPCFGAGNLCGVT